ncbi:polyamine-modulated factor 1-binding protein 1 isoform X1, partial [Clarias magur]
HSREMETCQDELLLQQLRKLSLSEQEAKMKVEEREAQIQQLQDTITELHQEMSLKDQDKLGQLQQLVLLETRVKELTQELQKSAQTIAQLRHEARENLASNSVFHREMSSDQTAAQGLELLKSELAHRDASIRKLQRDLLASHQARDTQSAQLDVQEQRLWELQRELQEKQQELQRGHQRLQQLSTELQSTSRNAHELQGQLREARTRLVQVEAENEALLGYKRLRTSEEEKLSDDLSSTQRGAEEEQDSQRKIRELEEELSATRTRLGDCQDGAQEDQKRLEEQIHQLQQEVSRLNLQHRCINQQLQERTVELRSLQKAHAELQVRDNACQRELRRIREELHNATLRAEEERLKEVQIDELQREVDRMLALLEKDREDGSQTEELETLRDQQLRLKDEMERVREVCVCEL